MDGERRLRASRQAKMSSIPCVVNDQDLTADRIMQLQLVANALRCDLSPLEAARAYQSLQVAWACSRKELAAQLNISESKLSRTMQILDLPEQQQQGIASGEIAPTVAVQKARVKADTVRKRASRPKATTIRTVLGDVVLTPKRADVQLIDLLQAAIHSQAAKGAA
jgi:ParB family chromosome partitioning protein